MLILNRKNVETLVFQDRNAQRAVPDLADLFQTYAAGRRFRALWPAGQQAVLSFFDRLTPRHIESLSAHFGDEVEVRPTDSHLVRTHSFSLDEAEAGLRRTVPADRNYFVWRDGDRLYVSTWR
jgi:hypothetical protein